MPRPVMAPLKARRVLTVALLLLVVLHVFPLPLGEPDQLLAGFIPWDLAYPLAWMAVAAMVVVYMTTAPWPDEPPPPRQPTLPSQPTPPPSQPTPPPSQPTLTGDDR